MKRTLYLFSLAAAFFIAACGNETDQQKTDSVSTGTVTAIGPAPNADSPTITVATPQLPSAEDTIISCFYLKENQLEKRMYMMRTGNTVMGDLQIDWEEKDDAKGSYFGSFSGDTMWGIYHVIIEGIKMQQEIVFILKDDKVILGEGELDESTTPQSFTNKKKIKFDSKRPLTKGSCF